MLAALFIQGGISALKAPQGHVQAARPVLDAVSPAVDKVVEIAPIDQRPDDEMLVRIDAGVKIVAGSMLALGKFPRLASTALAASLVPTTLAAHRFWEETDEAKKAEQQVHFLKNVGLLGGLLIAAADTHGKPSVAYRGRRAARRAQAAVADLTTTSGPGLGERVGSVAHDASGAVSGVAAGLVGMAPGAGAAVSSYSSKAGSQLSAAGTGLSARAADLSQDLSVRAAAAAKQAEKRGAEWQKHAETRGADWQKVAGKRRAELQVQAEKRRGELLKRTAKQRKQLAKQAAKKRKELEKRGPVVLDQVTTFGHDLAARASVVGAEIAHQAEGAAKDARKRVHALSS